MLTGIYHVFSFCQPVAAQMTNLTSNVAVDADSLPIAIDIEWYGKPYLPGEAACNSIQDIRNRVHDLAGRIERYSGKKPIIYAGTQALTEIIDESFSEYPLWIADYSARARVLSLPSKGRNPWTLWQFSSAAKIPGVRGEIDLNAFFGTEAQFQAFRAGKENVALSATR